MSEAKISLEEEVSSPEMFSDPDVGTNVSVAGTSDDVCSLSEGRIEPDIINDDPEWKGVSMDEIYQHKGPFNWQHLPPIQVSPSHTVLFKLPLPNRGPPWPYPLASADKWCQNFVRMPNSSHSLYPIDPENEKSGGLRPRWEVIQEALLQSFMSSHQLEAAILSYNHRYAEKWDFAAFHHFFNEYIDDEEMRMCLDTLVPKMIRLALQLPELITGSIPLLRRHTNKSISFSQLQVASLLANAFFCTFPRRNSSNPQSEYGSYPYMNFNGLFSSFEEDRITRCQSVMEKLKCIFHYFRRVTSRAPEGTITIQRRFISKKNCPRWEKQQMKLPPLHITSKGTIESQGAGLLQVDFANKFVGGGVLNYGCVQEEIRFVVCPELLITMLVTEALDDTEALIINGVERFSKYKGYSNSFKWSGDFIDETPRDSSGRLKTCVVAIDALYFKQPKAQFSMGNVIRELNKAYVGFSSEIPVSDLPAIATGNWGCGAFRGDAQLKVLLQLMAAAVAGRSVVYFTFGDTSLRDSIADMYWNLIRHDVDIGRLFALISQYDEVSPENRTDFYRFLYNRSKIKPLTHYFNGDKKKSSEVKLPSTSAKISPKKLNFNADFKKHASVAKLKEDELEDKIGEWLESVENDDLEESNKNACTLSDDVSTALNMQVESEKMEKRDDNIETATGNEVKVSPKRKMKQTFEEVFGDRSLETSSKKKVSNLDIFDKLILDEVAESPKNNESMEIDVAIGVDRERLPEPFVHKPSKNIQSCKKPSQRKINDFFKKQNR
ncbi:hypothetical protein QAD02_015333 [Eretmocerus hayati]|uniref:Uncharacterized protein n=1 Tax=Eretmocerus hayati TaxID=131215 RepID=A0ACC2P967_9HYME|nr:hypothetical protein QAD02_015333 [Eretmocerus hayati]